MADWKAVLKADPTSWLLEEDSPSVRYSTLTEILEKPDTEPEVERARTAIMKRGIVPRILAKQRKGGYWEAAQDFYIRTKYKGTVWQLITLAELRADGNDERIRKACEFILEHSQDRISGGFSYRSGAGGGGDHDGVLPCLTGNIVWSLIRFGYLEDPRVHRGIKWVVNYQRFDDAVEEPPRGWPYDRFQKCWGRHTCHMGVVKTLKALAEIPTNRRSEGVKNAIDKGVEYVLKHHIHKRSHDLNRVSRPELLQFGFPLMWSTDILEILGILTRLGCRDERMREAVDVVVSKQDDEGKWKLERTFNGRVQVNIEQKGKPSKWITMNALNVLKRFHSQSQP